MQSWGAGGGRDSWLLLDCGFRTEPGHGGPSQSFALSRGVVPLSHCSLRGDSLRGNPREEARGNLRGPGHSSSCGPRAETALLAPTLPAFLPQMLPQICFNVKTASGKGVHNSEKGKHKTWRPGGGFAHAWEGGPGGVCGSQWCPQCTVGSCADGSR